MVGCLHGWAWDSSMLRIRNTFLEWAADRERGSQRPSSSPPTCRFLSTSPASVQPPWGTKQNASPNAATCGVLGTSSTPFASPASTPPQKTMLHGEVDDVYGHHPSHPLWAGHTAIMLRNIPCRCKAYEIENMIMAGGVPSETWTMVMPPATKGRNRGYALITAADPATATELVHVLWQQTIPTRVSQRPLKLQPAFEDTLTRREAESVSLAEMDFTLM
eukprot:TRINITY_DN5303_c0_g3_i3.p1 TRINITY_DN5303_c0_g3~~TRINITY_DN5303_c0_g3_i3.p1  ORF type:complete len:219 (+),score=27.77 TRINITY_DN5303_c0_g3_i3:71-727(+)